VIQHLLPVIATEWVAEPLHRRGGERLLREDRCRLSLVDCVSLEFMHDQGGRDVGGLDPQFVEAGYRLLPAPRP
jgi:hypothetical protein